MSCLSSDKPSSFPHLLFPPSWAGRRPVFHPLTLTVPQALTPPHLPGENTTLYPTRCLCHRYKQSAGGCREVTPPQGGSSLLAISRKLSPALLQRLLQTSSLAISLPSHRTWASGPQAHRPASPHTPLSKPGPSSCFLPLSPLAAKLPTRADHSSLCLQLPLPSPMKLIRLESKTIWCQAADISQAP